MSKENHSNSVKRPHPIKTIGIMGGTYDPIHYGHLRTGYELMQAIGMDELRFIPAGDPPHKNTTIANAEQRLAMVKLAVADQKGFIADDREVTRAGASYTVLTLESLRQEFPDASLCLILGMDAFLGLPKWHRWEEILDFTNLVIAHRPGYLKPTDGRLQELVAKRATAYGKELAWHTTGKIYIHSVTQLEIASSKIRFLLRSGLDTRYLLPDTVNQYLTKVPCYTDESACS